MTSQLEQSVEAGELQSPPGRQARILLVDDREPDLLALDAVLADLRQDVVKVRSGRDALKQLLDHDFAVILLDVQMPDMTGFETAQIIRSRPKSEHTPILFLTSYRTDEIQATRGYLLGAVDYVYKPFQPEVIKAKVSAFVDLHLKTIELEDEVARRKDAEAAVRALNTDLERRVADRTAALQSINEELKQEIEHRVRVEAELRSNRDQIRALNERLQRAMTETHHRVKNNLQLIAAMVDMHMMQSPAAITLEDLARLSHHVRTLAAVHDVLTYQAKEDGEAASVSAKNVLERLLPMLQESNPGRRIRYLLDDARLGSRQGTSLALITNELVSNSIKHGCAEVQITFKNCGARGLLQVEDDGPGFPPEFDASLNSSTGLELVQSLAQFDLGCAPVYSNRIQGGGQVSLEIPLAAHAA